MSGNVYVRILKQICFWNLLESQIIFSLTDQMTKTKMYDFNKSKIVRVSKRLSESLSVVMSTKFKTIELYIFIIPSTYFFVAIFGLQSMCNLEQLIGNELKGWENGILASSHGWRNHFSINLPNMLECFYDFKIQPSILACIH